jgi:propanediol dehydratase small subunit
MTNPDFSAADYPTAEKCPDQVRGHRGKSLEALTLEAAMSGEIEMADLRITPEALLRQAQIARSVGRAALAENFERAAEMTALPQEKIMQIYELLRPGRAPDAEALQSAAAELHNEWSAPALAAFLEEAAEVYARRGLFRVRY